MSVKTSYVRRLAGIMDYADVAQRTLPAEVPVFWSVSPVDVLTMSMFLDRCRKEVIMLDIGAFIGVSAFCFASQPRVARVISVDPNPKIADEVSDKEDSIGVRADYAALSDTRVLDVAREAIRNFPEQRRKIMFVEGVVGTSQVGIEGATLDVGVDGFSQIEVPKLDPYFDDVELVAFVDGLHTKDGVFRDLEAIFAASPGATAMLHDCRSSWGPEVRAGANEFVQRYDGYRFELLESLGRNVGTPNLGFVYPESRHEEVHPVLEDLRNPMKVVGMGLSAEASNPASVLSLLAKPALLKKGFSFVVNAVRVAAPGGKS